MAHLLDSLFHFPSDPTSTADHVKAILELLDLPVVVMDKRFHSHLVNKAGEERLARYSIKLGDRSRRGNYRSFRALVRPNVVECLNTGRVQIVPNVPPPDLRDAGFRTVVCPGRIRDAKLAFVIGLADCAELDLDIALQQIFEGFRIGAIMFGPDLRHRVLNSRALDIFKLKRGETVGKLTSEINPSPQAKVLEQQFKQLIVGRQSRIEEAYPVASSKRGVILSRLIIWPVWNSDGRSEGLMILVDPLDAQAAALEPDRKTLEMLGREGYFHGPPLFYTHVDGRVSVMNAAARALAGTEAADRHINFRTDLKWAHPEVIDSLYGDILRGAGVATALAELETPSGPKPMRIAARGLRDVGEIVSQVYFVLTDASEYESTRRLLADTVRSLAREKEVLERIVDAMDLPVAVVDGDLRVIRINGAMAGRLRISPDDAVGRRIDEVVPTARETGVADLMRTAMDKGEEVYVERLEHIMQNGEMMPMEITFYPMRIEGKRCCMAISRELMEKEKLEARAARWKNLYEAVVSNTSDGITVLDNDSIITDVNDVVAGPRGGREKVIGTPGDSHLAANPEKEVILEAKRKALRTGETQRTGLLRVVRNTTGEEHFVDVTYVPLRAPGGKPDGVLTVIHFATGVVNLKRQIGEYTKELERRVRERTEEISAANAALAKTVERITGVAESGVLLGSLKDPESVYEAFVDRARGVLNADYVNLVVVEKRGDASHTAYYSAGTAPSRGALDSQAIEGGIAGLMLGGERSDPVRMPRPDQLLVDIDVGWGKALLVAYREGGEFGEVAPGLAQLLRNQLAFTVPVARYVSELKGSRDQADCLRRIAVRVAGAASSGEAIRVVAEEIAAVIPIDRLLWVVTGRDGDLWVSEVYNRSGSPDGGARRIGVTEFSMAEHSRALKMMPGKSFCEMAGGMGPGAEHLEHRGMDPAASKCPFSGLGGRSVVSERVGAVLERAQVVSGTECLLTVVPVMLCEGSWGLLCACPAGGLTLSHDDTCFMCVAASTIAYVWKAADAASVVRRLEAASETVSDLVHDLKYPLNKISRDLEELERTAGSAGACAPGIASIKIELGNLRLLANELTEIANPRSHQPEIMDVSEVVEHCLSVLSSDIALKAIEIRNLVGRALPILADRQDVTRVLLNILSNGVEAVAANGLITIALRAAPAQAGVKLVGVVFEDSGPGVPASDVHKVFDAFYTTKDGGTGLGLFSAKKRARANGGDVVCEIGGDGKSRFIAAFPAAGG